MKTTAILFIVFLACISVTYGKDLITGTSFNGRLIWQEKVEYNAIPLKKRVKEVFFSDPGQQLIKVSKLNSLRTQKNCDMNLVRGLSKTYSVWGQISSKLCNVL